MREKCGNVATLFAQDSLIFTEINPPWKNYNEVNKSIRGKLTMKKNLLSLLLAAGLAGSIFAAPVVFAAEDPITQPASVTATQAQLRDGTGENTVAPGFVDEDKDGICDNYAEGTPLMMRDGTGKPDGTPRATGQRKGSAENYVDKDKDGVCDNLALGTPKNKQAGSAKADKMLKSLGQKKATGEQFKDNDKDGVCDNFADKTPIQKKDGTGNANLPSSAGKRAGKGK